MEHNIEQTIQIPYIVHESDMARIERREKRMWIAILLLILMPLGEWLCRKFISFRKQKT